MEYTSESSVIKAGNNRIKNPFGSSFIAGLVSVLRDNIKSSKFIFPIVFFGIIISAFSTLYTFIAPLDTLGSQDAIFSNTFSIIVIFFFVMLILMSMVIAPFIFKRNKTFGKKITDQIQVSSY